MVTAVEDVEVIRADFLGFTCNYMFFLFFLFSLVNLDTLPHTFYRIRSWHTRTSFLGILDMYLAFSHRIGC